MPKFSFVLFKHMYLVPSISLQTLTITMKVLPKRIWKYKKKMLFLISVEGVLILLRVESYPHSHFKLMF